MIREVAGWAFALILLALLWEIKGWLEAIYHELVSIRRNSDQVATHAEQADNAIDRIERHLLERFPTPAMRNFGH